MISTTLLPLFKLNHNVKTPQGYFLRGAHSMYSNPICPPGYVKSSLLRVLRSRYLCIHARQLTKGMTISSFFHYARQAIRTTLQAVQLWILG